MYARLGIVHAPEGRSVFASLTVQENLELTFRRSRGRAQVHDALDEAYSCSRGSASGARQLAGTLSGGEQRMLSLARVLVEKPRLLIADELSLGLAPIVVDEVYRTLETIRDSGTTLLIVEQHVHHALALADDAIVLVKGEVAFAGPVDELGDLQSADPRRRSRAPPTPDRSGYEPNSAACVTRASVSTICVRSTRTWRDEHVVVETFEHRDERERRDHRVEVGRVRGRRCAR